MNLHRAIWLLLVFRAYAFGDHVADPRAYRMRLHKVRWV